METYLKLTEQFEFSHSTMMTYNIKIAKDAYVHMKDNLIMAVWNANNVPSKVKKWATEMSLNTYLQNLQQLHLI